MTQGVSSAFYKAIFEQARDGILVADAATKKCVLANAQACRLTGYALDDLLKIRITEIHPKRDRPRVLRQLAKEGTALVKNIPILRKDKKTIYCDVQSSVVQIGKRIVLLFFREAAHPTAQAESSWMAKFPEENPNPVMRVGKDGIILYANKASAPLLRSLRCQPGKKICTPFGPLAVQALRSRSRVTKEIKVKDHVLYLTFIAVGGMGYVNIYGIDVTENKKDAAEIRVRHRESEKFNKMAVGRELRMIELKKRIAELEKELQEVKS